MENMEFITFQITFLILFFIAFLVVVQVVKDRERSLKNLPVIDYRAERLLYMTKLQKEEVVERMSRHNVMDIFEYEFRETERPGIYDLNFKEIRKYYEYKVGMVRYDMCMEEDHKGNTRLILKLSERSSPAAQARFSQYMHEFMMQKLEAGYGYVPAEKEGNGADSGSGQA